MKKIFGIVLAVLFCMMPLSALAEGEEGADATDAPEVIATAQPEASPTAPDTIVISPVQSDEHVYKDLLMDSLKQTLLGKNASLKSQLSKILYLDDITVTADNYNRIVLLVQNAINTQKLSDGASLDHYTDEDFAIAAKLIGGICDELGLGYSIDPSNDSQNEYARVVTITKNGKVLGRINSDAKTDVGERPSIGWIIGGGVLIGGAAVLGLILVLAVTKKKKAA
ncbi:MAG: hypothetical protein IJK88_08420 [Clostridia bacterium]|nr:hypothetical protein [Clostridia bacterium]MBR3129245.1 hypothetical protein [Clostridia bacterium]